jgi:hypothetical protein
MMQTKPEERVLTFQLLWSPGATCVPSVLDLLQGTSTELPRKYVELVQQLTKPERIGFRPVPKQIRQLA